MRLSALVVCLAASLSLAQSAQFDAGNKYLSEQSFSKACESFEAFLKGNAGSPLAREATAKRAFACWRAGRSSGSTELTKLADTGEQDFARAYAQWALATQGYRNFQQAIPLLKTATKAEGRVGDEARRLLVAGCLVQLDNQYYDVKLAESLTSTVLEYATSEADKAHARFARAQGWLQSESTRGKAEQELTDLGAGSTAWADDALYLLGQQREGRERYADALTIYDGIVKRFSPTTSNRHADARSSAENIRRPTLSVSAYQVALPGLKLPVSLSWRNVKRITWTLRRVDPFAGSPSHSPDSVDAYPGGAVEKTWSESLEVKTAYAPGSRSFELELPSPGLFVLEASGDGLTARDFAMQSQLGVITKSDRKQVQVFVADVETGKAQPDAEVLLVRSSFDAQQRARTNAQGLATFQLEKDSSSSSHYVWVKHGQQVAHGHAGHAYWSSWSRQELAYVLMDRPLYKPGETVGLKLFLRSREGGPSEPIANRTVTVQVRDPNGKEVAKPSLTTNGFGTASTTVALPKTATLGAWYVNVSDGQHSYQQPSLTFRVEEYKPPEATVSVSPVGSPKPGDPVKLKVTAKYYSGGPLTGAQGRAVVTVSHWQHQFGKWPDEEQDGQPEYGGYDDYDDERPYRRGGYRGRYGRYYGPVATHTLVFKTGADGTAEIEVPATPDQGSDLQVTAQVFVTDASRREIAGSGTAKLSRSPYFVDVRSDHFLYRPGERVTLRLRSEDANGRPMSPDVVVRLSRISDPNTGALSKIAEARTKIVDGKGLAQLDADALGAVRVEVVDVDAKPEQPPLATTDLWLTSDTKPIPPPGPGFQLLTDRAPLAVGQAMRALIVTPEPGGHVWLTLEHDLLVTSRVIEMAGRTRYVELPLPAEATPNAWLFASRYERGDVLQQQHELRVKGSEVELDVKVAFDRAVAEPGASVPVSIRATKGVAGPLETALTVVDEALFAIEPERQDFLSFFGRQRRNHSVQTRRSTDWRRYLDRPVPQPVVTGAKRPEENRGQATESKSLADAKAEPSSAAGMAMAAPAPASRAASAEREEAPAKKAKDSAGPRDADDESGAVGADAPVKARTDFGSSAGWYPQLTGRLDSPLLQPVKVTDSLTSWKAIATVVTQGPHLGRGAATMRTARPLMVRLQTPRFLIEGDEVVLSAVIESHLPKAGPVEVTLTAQGLLALGPTKKTVTVTPEQVARFDVRFKVVELGDRLIRAQAKSGATGDAMELTIPALVHGSAQRQFFAGRLGDTFSFDVELPQKRKAALTKLELNLSPSLLAVMLDGLPYLAQYPYGCVEQTLSRFVPAVIARKAVKDLSLPSDKLPPNLDDMVQKGLERLAGFQHGDGGWGWWQSDRTNLWMTAYVVYALGLAKDAGLAFDAGMISRGRNYLVGHLGEALDNPDTHAFAVYALVQSGGAPKAVLDQAFERRTKMQPRGRALVALALLTAKDPRARIAVENLDDVVKTAEARKDAAVGEANDAWSTSAAIEATAYTLMAMSRWGEGAKYVGPLTDFLVLRRNGGKWRTTRDTAFAIYALADIARREKAFAQQGSFTVTINGKQVKQLKYSKGGLDVPALVFTDADFKPGKNTVQVRRDGGGTGYWAGTWDVFNQNDFIKGVGGDVKVARRYTLLGKPSAERGSAPTEYGMPVESGVRVRVDVEITANKAVEFVMLEDLKPAGFEAVQQRSGPEVCNYACAHAELRTDRVAMFLSELRVGTTKLSYELRAETPGKFSALPARAEAMYAPEIQATADEMRFEVRDAPTSGVAAQ